MGCDIHPHIEVKIKGRWEHYSCPPIRRHYRLFEKICGVRGEVINAIAEPRGFPSDISIVTKTCWDLEGGHTPTWLTAEELDELIRWAEVNYDNMFQHHEVGYLNGNMFSHRDPEWEDVRFVCWFDN